MWTSFELTEVQRFKYCLNLIIYIFYFTSFNTIPLSPILCFRVLISERNISLPVSSCPNYEPFYLHFFGLTVTIIIIIINIWKVYGSVSSSFLYSQPWRWFPYISTASYPARRNSSSWCISFHFCFVGFKMLPVRFGYYRYWRSSSYL